MKRVLVTGMSGAGKSSLLSELATRGYRTVDTDYGDYFRSIDGERLWREDRTEALLAGVPDEFPGVLFVTGTTRNQALFYSRFDRIVLLSASPAILAQFTGEIANSTVASSAFGACPDRLEMYLDPWASARSSSAGRR